MAIDIDLAMIDLKINMAKDNTEDMEITTHNIDNNGEEEISYSKK